jgi:hypothetical protein
MALESGCWSEELVEDAGISTSWHTRGKCWTGAMIRRLMEMTEVRQSNQRGPGSESTRLALVKRTMVGRRKRCPTIGANRHQM